MARTKSIKPWVGKDDDHWPPSRACARRVKDKTNQCCANCKIYVRYGGHIDHTIPIQQGGANAEHNLQWLCSACHSAKTSREATSRAKANRVQDKHHNLRPKPRGFWKPPKAARPKPEKVWWLDEQGRLRLSYMKPTSGVEQ